MPVLRELQVEVEYSDTYEGCFVCGRENPNGLRLEFSRDTEKKEVYTRWRPKEYMQGFKEVVHGGFITMVLDEVMAKVCLFDKKPAVTLRIEVRFIKPIRVDEEIIVRGRCVETRGRRLKLEAWCEDGAGEKRVEAGALFLAV